jgi:hypothetical protein
MSSADYAARAIALGNMAKLGALDAGLGGQLVGYRAPDPDTVGRTVSERLNDVVCVKDFGAVGDGVTDDTEAIHNALRALFVRTPLFYNYRTGTGRLYFPEGVYRITSNGVLSNWPEWQRSNFMLQGAGARNSVLWLDPSALSGEAWFYDNFDSQRQWGMVCEDLCFAGGYDWQEAMPSGVGYGLSNISPLCNGFKLTGPGWESAFVFSRCEFRFLQMVFHAAGTNNVDTHRFIACATNKCVNVNYINNPQALSINWLGCYVDQIFGNFLEYGPNCNGGGGNFLMQGGAIIALAGGGDTTPHYVVKATAGGTSQSNAPVTFRDVRFELRGNYHGFAYATFGNTQVLASGCSFHNTGSVNKNLVTVGQFCVVRFEGTSFNKGDNGGNFTYQIGESGDGRLGKNAHLIFANSCLIDPALFFATGSTVSWAGNGGRLTVDETCWATDVTDATAQPRVYAYATDTFGPASLNGEGQAVSTKHRTRRQFEVSPFFAQSSMAGTNGLSGTAVRIPPYSRIVGVWVKIAAGVGNANTVRCLIGNNDKSVIYASTVAGPQNAGHYVYANVHVPVGNDNNKRDIRFWFDDGAGGASTANSSIRVDGGVIYGGA